MKTYLCKPEVNKKLTAKKIISRIKKMLKCDVVHTVSDWQKHPECFIDILIANIEKKQINYIEEV